MCGIFFAYSNTNAALTKLRACQDSVAHSIQFRGPDATHIVQEDTFTAIHTLLSITGSAHQPMEYAHGLFLYNGEIYNDWQKYSDKYGDADFLKSYLNSHQSHELGGLDGEFALIIFDKENKQLHLATDPFATKPLYYALTDDMIVTGSYDHTLKLALPNCEPIQVPANMQLSFDLERLEMVNKQIIRPFIFDQDDNNDFTAYKTALTKAVKKRSKTTHHKLYVSLSSGHDSGLIAAELEAANIPFSAYGFAHGEREDILQERMDRLTNKGLQATIMETDSTCFERMENYLAESLPPYYLVNSDSPDVSYNNADMRHVSGYIAAAVISQHAREDGYYISLSGQGVDEIVSDYFNPHSNSRRSLFRGDWTQARKPWANFYGGWNRIYLGGIERISGHFGIETRYPFLDHDVVQAFLHLSPEAKGRRYKGPISERLEELNYPFHDYKYGFAGYDPKILKQKAG